jgi:SOS-response transcriptional repressor LexA
MISPGKLSEEECKEMEMTPKERSIFLAIDEHWKKFGYGPSYEDIMRVTGDKGRGNVYRVIGNLVKLGICKKLPGKDRSVRPVYIKFRELE